MSFDPFGFTEFGRSVVVAASGSPVAASIVALWDFESSGRGADSAGSNDLTVVGSPSYAAGKIGDAASGFTTSDYFNSPSSYGPYGTLARTVSAWFKTTNATAASECILNSGGTAVAGSAFFTTVENGVIWARCSGGRVASFGSGFNDDTWHYLTITYDDGADLSDVVLMVDGVTISRTSLSNDGPLDLVASSDGTTVGGNAPSGSARPFLGSLDQVLIADRLWSLSDHQYAYNSGTGRTTSELLTA